ncbi:MAG: PqqD family protein [Prevotella sp.]|jgi:hypothetical protein|nr:PqqD family protein [Prevotella sp.]
MKHKIEIAPLLDYYVIAVKDKETDNLVETFTLNESGTDMLRLFCQDKDVTAVAQKMAEMYEAPLELVTKDVSAFAEKLQKKGLI